MPLSLITPERFRRLYPVCAVLLVALLFAAGMLSDKLRLPGEKVAVAASTGNSVPLDLSQVPPPIASSAVKFDFDGDGKADIGRWQIASNGLRVRSSSTSNNLDYSVGSYGEKLAPGDFNGDGSTDAAVFSGGTWTYKTSTTATAQTISHGTTGDIPVAADYDGDGKTDAAIFRPSTNVWSIKRSSDSQIYSTTWGAAGDLPVTGDYDGDGLSDFVVWRPSTGLWYLNMTSAGYYTTTWGTPASDIPVAGDFDGDGKTDIAVFRKTTGVWYIRTSTSGFASWITQSWGNVGDQPVPADYDGDGQDDYAVWRPTTGVWWLVYSGDNYSIHTYTLGESIDRAAPAAYLKQVGGAVLADELAASRLSPRNATGGTDLYSQNFSWGRSLVSLTGRAGLDLSLGISYNSLVWTKSGDEFYFDADGSNAGPGFRLGFPVIEPIYYDGAKSKFAYMMVAPSGARIEFRETAVSQVYETADSSYAQLKTIGASNPNDPVTGITIIVTTTDGTQMKYLWEAGADRFVCKEIKDRNGNFITIGYDSGGRLNSVTDTLGRVVTITNTDGYPTSITQNWKASNGEGPSTDAKTWAAFTYTNKTINTNYYGLSVIGPLNGHSLKVLDKITYLDGSSTKFTYNAYGQVYMVANIAADSPSHELNSTELDLETPTVSDDVPRFVWTKTKAESFNNGDPVTVTNSSPTSSSFSLQGGTLTGSSSRVKVAVTGHPNQLYSLIHFAPSGWKEGLTLATEDCTGTDDACADRKRWTWNDFEQDNTSVSYILNPRVKEARVGDDVSTRKTQLDYLLYDQTTIAKYGLVKEARVYAADLSTVIKRTETDYDLSSAYTDRRILGLPSEVRAWGKNDLTNNLEQASKVTYVYDGENFQQESNQVPALGTANHDTASYGSTFIAGRGNLTSVTRHDVTAATAAVTSKTRYDIAGSVVARLDPLDRKVRVEYNDVFNDGVNRYSFAYPTRVYDPANNYSDVKYRYDIGANVWAKSPAPAGNSSGKETTREYDDKGRLSKETIVNNGAYTRYEYPENGTQSKVFSTIVDTNSNGADSADEVLSESWFDGSGRLLKSRTPHTFDTNGDTLTWAGTLTEYDKIGRVTKQSVPTEVDSSWAAAGDDATRGFLWTHQKYDWKNRVVRKINTDGNPAETENDSDILITYEGCGCAGGQVTTVEGELIKQYDSTYQIETLGRRKQKTYEDILGRAFKTEMFNWNGSVYSTIKSSFNGRDQVIETKHFQGTDTSTTFQTTTTGYDGHGRISSRRLPEYDTNASDVWTYNADDSIDSIIDARGATTDFSYNSRGLLTLAEYDTPNATTIPDTPDVSFVYDNAENRTSMTDGTGTTAYAYDSLSQLASETKQFSGVTGSFTTAYGYHLGGGIKSVSVPGDSTRTVTYSMDRTGAMTGATGNSGTLVQNRKLRVFGGLKEEEYGNGYKLSQEFDTGMRIADYKIRNSSSQTVANTAFEYNAAGQVLRANGQYNFDRYYAYDHVGRMIGNKTKWTGTTSYTAYDEGLGYDVWSNLTARNYASWGYYINSQSAYSNNRITQITGWNSQTGTMPNEYWQFDASGNATASGEQTHKIDAAGRKIQSLEQTPNQQRTELLIQQSYDGDGRVVKRYDREIITGQPNQEKTEYSLISSVFGGAVIAKVTPAGVRGEDTVFDPTGRSFARNGSTVTYLHETPFTASSFESTGSSATALREFEPLGGEIRTTEPPSTSPDWIPMGNYQQTGNPLDVQGGCLEDGFPVDCSEMARRMCFGNPRCMNKENRVGGLGYLLAGVQARGDFKGWRGYKQLDGKLVPVVEIARWADKRIMPLIGYAGLADGFAEVWGSASLSSHAAQTEQDRSLVRMTTEEVQRLWQGVDATVVGRCADFIKRLGEAVTGKEIYDVKLWLAAGLSRAAAGKEGTTSGVYWGDADRAHNPWSDFPAIEIGRYKGSIPLANRHESPQWFDPRGNYRPDIVSVIHEIIHVAARADDQVLARFVQEMGITVYAADGKTTVDPPKPGEYGGNYWGAALRNHCDETATYLRAKRR